MEFPILMTPTKLIPALLLLALVACEKEITVDLPTTEPKLVVEGTIEPGRPPIVILTRTQSFFAPTDLASIASIFVNGALITMSDGFTTITLDAICSSDLTDEEIILAAAITGLDPDLLTLANICVYTSLNPADTGVIGRTYSLQVIADGKTLTSITTLPAPVALDSAWFKLALQDPGDDTLGFIWGRLSDPAGSTNQYRWLAQRINRGYGGKPKDASYIAPLFSCFDDRYANGLSFEFAYNRGTATYSTAEDDENEEAGFFKRGDTVVVKFVSFGRPEYDFYNSLDDNTASQGDLFSNPENVVSNINGGLGIWAGWSPSYYTVVCGQ